LFTIIGFLPRRGDFDHEYDEDADQLIDDLNFMYYSDEHEDDA
jgi:hypothetical protein